MFWVFGCWVLASFCAYCLCFTWFCRSLFCGFDLMIWCLTFGLICLILVWWVCIWFRLVLCVRWCLVVCFGFVVGFGVLCFLVSCCFDLIVA